MNRLEKMGTQYRLKEDSGKTHTFSDAQAAVNHINRFDIAKDTESLECLPQFFYNQVTGRGPQPIKEIVREVLQSSGLTNPALIA